MPTREASRLLERAAAFRAELEDANQAAADRMTRSWAGAQARLNVEASSLLKRMEAARLAGVAPSPAWLYQERRLTSLVSAIQAEVFHWGPNATETIRDAAYAASARAEGEAALLAREAAVGVGAAAVAEASFTALAPDNMTTILGHLAPDGPLRELMARLATETVEAAELALTNGVVLGQGSDHLARELSKALDVPRWRAETIGRTEALRAYRETSRLTYVSSGVLAGWVWTAALDRRTCPGCLGLHGQEFGLEEQLDGHPRCRCAMVPFARPLGIQTGDQWLAAQSPAAQVAILGPRKAELYQAGEMGLGDMVARTRSPEWGTMRRERSIREWREGRNADHRDAA